MRLPGAGNIAAARACAGSRAERREHQPSEEVYINQASARASFINFQYGSRLSPHSGYLRGLARGCLMGGVMD